jgi:adenylate cyclase
MALEQAYIMQKRHEEAIAAAEKAVKLGPGFANAYGSLGDALIYAGRAKEALVYLEKELRMDPFPPAWVYGEIGAAHFILGNYEESISAGKKALSISPKYQMQRAGQIAAYVEMGRMEEARAEVEELLRIDPKFTISGYEKIAPWKDSRVTERLIEAWRKVGLDRKANRN